MGLTSGALQDQKERMAVEELKGAITCGFAAGCCEPERAVGMRED